MRMRHTKRHTFTDRLLWHAARLSVSQLSITLYFVYDINIIIVITASVADVHFIRSTLRAQERSSVHNVESKNSHLLYWLYILSNNVDDNMGILYYIYLIL